MSASHRFAAGSFPRRHLPDGGNATLLLSIVIPAVLAVVDVAVGVRLTGLLAVGPCLAVACSRARWVAVVTAYVVVVMALLAIPNGTWGTEQQAYSTGGGLLVGGVCVWLAARKGALERSTAQTERSRSMLAAIVESADEAIVGCDLDGVVTTWNAGAERLYGYRADEVVGRGVALIEAPDPGSHRPGVARLLARGESVDRLDSVGRHRDGRVLDLSISVSPVRDDTGAVVGSSAFVRDNTPRRAATAEREQLEQQLHQFQRVESLGQLAGGIAHDFNNLLAVITTSADFITDESGDPNAVRADAAQIRSAADRAAQLTRQLLLFARGEHLPAQTVDLDVVVNGLRPLLERSAGTAIDFRTRTTGTPPTVHADVGRIEQLLLNLVVNARDAMPEGGRLLVATSVVDLTGEEPGLTPPPRPGPHVLLSVRDHGSGMAPEVAARIFEPFFSTKPKTTGTGLGLATVWGIVTEARGSIGVDTAPGSGTTIRVFLPRVVPLPVAGPVPAAGRSARVLVVEDEEPIRALVVRILRHAGHEVLAAASGAEALEVAADGRLDLLLTDLAMPGMSGEQLAGLLVERQAGLPVLFTSGYSGTPKQDRARGDSRARAGTVAGVGDAVGGGYRPPSARGLLEKPFTERELLEQVRLALAGASSTAAPAPVPEVSATPGAARSPG